MERLLKSTFLVTCAVLSVAAAPALGQPQIDAASGGLDAVNALYDDIQDGRRSDTVVLPVIAGMDPAPVQIGDRLEAMLFSAQRPGWDEIAAWCAKPAQQAMVAALDQVTEETDYRVAHAFGQPYGEAGVDPALVKAGLYSPLGVEGLVASVRFEYLDGLGDAERFVHAEATRLSAEGDPRAAMDLLTDWAFFCRQICDRAFWLESRWGYERLASALERMTDVVYVDRNGSKELTPQDLVDVVDRLNDDVYLGLDRLTTPQGGFLAAEALARLLLPASGEVDAGAFATTMARLESGDRPLRLFGQSGRYINIADAHADRTTTLGAISRVRGDMRQRWEAPAFSSLLSAQPEMAQAISPRLAIPEAVLTRGGTSPLDGEAMRDELRVLATGVRHALGVVGYELRFGAMPPDISSIRPVWVERIEADAWNPNTNVGRVPPMQFFVPVRDSRISSGPHTFKFESPLLEDAPDVTVGGDGFVMYSVGPDGQRDYGRRMRNHRVASPGSDFLIWPPALSVLREQLGG